MLVYKIINCLGQFLGLLLALVFVFYVVIKICKWILGDDYLLFVKACEGVQWRLKYKVLKEENEVLRLKLKGYEK